MSVGVAPGGALECNGFVVTVGWLEMIDDRGTAVGFVANKVKVMLGVVEFAEPVVPPLGTPVGTPVVLPVGTDGVPEVETLVPLEVPDVP